MEQAPMLLPQLPLTAITQPMASVPPLVPRQFQVGPDTDW